MRLTFDFGSVLVSGYDENGWPEVQYDGFGEDDGGALPCELPTWFGFRALPHPGTRAPNGDVDSERSCRVLLGRGNYDGHAWPLNDPRWSFKLPKEQPGGSMQYGGKLGQPAFSLIDGESGSYQLYVPYAFSGEGEDAVPAKAMSIAVNVRNAGAESIEIIHGDGMAITVLAGGKNAIVLKNKAGNAFLVIDDDGVTAVGPTKLYGGVEVGLTTLDSKVALASPLLEYLTALETLLKAMAPRTVPTSATELATFVAASTALTGKIASSALGAQ